MVVEVIELDEVVLASFLSPCSKQLLCCSYIPFSYISSTMELLMTILPPPLDVLPPFPASRRDQDWTSHHLEMSPTSAKAKDLEITIKSLSSSHLVLGLVIYDSESPHLLIIAKAQQLLGAGLSCSWSNLLQLYGNAVLKHSNAILVHSLKDCPIGSFTSQVQVGHH